LGVRAHAAAIGFQRKQHGERRQMDVVVVTVTMTAVMVRIMVTMIVMMTMVMSMMVVVAMVPAVMGAAVFLRLAFIQLKRLAHTDVVFAHR
jgi:hypothetical protein